MKKLLVSILICLSALMVSTAEARPPAKVLASGEVYGRERPDCIADWRLTTVRRPYRILAQGPTRDGAGSWDAVSLFSDGFVQMDVRDNDRLVYTNLTEHRIRAVVVTNCH